ncbi:hypothetical protein L3Q72_06755 [Vibrio sp. JC009]|uniref:hypothetical protein n=1 Tax=Vibrio sp. JC009 TaxID=2912314 RepID=UPI0023B0FA8C|nr:hypothetical protein [Vibrio sp. JC009]WED23088.1 hypothetical protein L3Q72_06755 [Vibrio sp. JC009]
MRVNARKGELVTDLLFKYTGQDDDQTEAAFYELNTHVRAAIFPEDCSVLIPEVPVGSQSQDVTRSWS